MAAGIFRVWLSFFSICFDNTFLIDTVISTCEYVSVLSWWRNFTGQSNPLVGRYDNCLGNFVIEQTSIWIGILIELSLTFIFLTMILMITMNKKNLHQYLAPIYIGCTLSVCIFASYVKNLISIEKSIKILFY